MAFLQQPTPHAADIPSHDVHVVVALLGFPFEGLPHDADKLRIDTGHALVERDRAFLQNAVEDTRVDRARERLRESDRFIQNGTSGKNIRPVIDTTADDLFRRHVVDGTHHHAVLRHAGIGKPRDPEVENLQDTFDRRA